MNRLSSALRDAIMTDHGLGIMMQYGVIHVYTGPQPDSADHGVQGTLLGTVTEDGAPFTPGELTGGLRFKMGPVRGAIQNNGNWVLTTVAAGTPGWWRFVWNLPDTGTGDDDTPRIDGLIGETLILPETDVVPSQTIPLAQFFLLLPPHQLP